MSVVELLCSEVEKGKDFEISFEQKSLKIIEHIGRKKIEKYLVKGGVFDGEYGISVENPKDQLEELFNEYYNSYPSSRSSKLCSYFVARNDLNAYEMAAGQERVMAQAKLESYVLGLILLKVPFSEFEKDENRWFWQSQKNKYLRLNRNWFKE